MVLATARARSEMQDEREALLSGTYSADFNPDFIMVDTLARHAVGVRKTARKTWEPGLRRSGTGA